MLDRNMWELQTWLDNRWLLPYHERELGPPRELIQLMALVQENKGNVHPILEYYELNKHFDTLNRWVQS